MKLGTEVCVIYDRLPVTLAKEVASLGVHSSGRLLFKNRQRRAASRDGLIKESDDLRSGCR